MILISVENIAFMALGFQFTARGTAPDCLNSLSTSLLKVGACAYNKAKVIAWQNDE